MAAPVDKKTKELVVGLFSIFILIVILIGVLSGKKDDPILAPQAVTVADSKPKDPPQPSKDDKATKEYALKLKKLLLADLKTVDTHLEDQGIVKLLFVTVSLNEWHQLNKDSQHKLVELILRHLRQNFKDDTVEVFIGVDASQPLAEGKWLPKLDNFDITIMGIVPEIVRI